MAATIVPNFLLPNNNENEVKKLAIIDISRFINNAKVAITDQGNNAIIGIAEVNGIKGKIIKVSNQGQTSEIISDMQEEFETDFFHDIASYGNNLQNGNGIIGFIFKKDDGKGLLFLEVDRLGYIRNTALIDTFDVSTFSVSDKIAKLSYSNDSLFLDSDPINLALLSSDIIFDNAGITFANKDKDILVLSGRRGFLVGDLDMENQKIEVKAMYELTGECGDARDVEGCSRAIRYLHHTDPSRARNTLNFIGMLWTKPSAVLFERTDFDKKVIIHAIVRTAAPFLRNLPFTGEVQSVYYLRTVLYHERTTQDGQEIRLRTLSEIKIAEEKLLDPQSEAQIPVAIKSCISAIGQRVFVAVASKEGVKVYSGLFGPERLILNIDKAKFPQLGDEARRLQVIDDNPQVFNNRLLRPFLTQSGLLVTDVEFSSDCTQLAVADFYGMRVHFFNLGNTFNPRLMSSIDLYEEVGRASELTGKLSRYPLPLNLSWNGHYLAVSLANKKVAVFKIGEGGIVGLLEVLDLEDGLEEREVQTLQLEEEEEDE